MSVGFLAEFLCVNGKEAGDMMERQNSQRWRAK